MGLRIEKGDTTTGAVLYIAKAFIIAKAWFGDHVHFWDEATGMEDYCPWKRSMQMKTGTIGSNEVKEALEETHTFRILKMTVENSAPNDQLYTIQSIQDKGRGFIATSKIPMGARILVENALFTFRPSEMNNPLIFSEIFRGLDKGQIKEFMSLHNAHHAKYFVVGIARTNALPMSSRECGVFLRASLLNHSCQPNATYACNPISKRLTDDALKDIDEGEEITISYLLTERIFEARQEKLAYEYGFICSCELCSLPPELRLENDQRWGVIAILEESLWGDIVNQPQDALDRGFHLLLLYRREGIADSRLRNLYFGAMQVVIGHGDQARAKLFAQMAFAVSVTIEGDDHPMAIVFDRFAKSRHIETPGFSTRWKQPINRIPYGLGPTDFVSWLWRRTLPN